MYRRVLAAAALVVTLAPAARAAERATFILTNGSRESGDVVFHGTGNRNIIDDHLNLGQGGREKTFPVADVAIIDFAGGDPSVAEFQQLPGDAQHLLVLRGGAMQRGRLVNLVNGDTVMWQNEAGQGQQYGIRDVSRVYLNASAARGLFPQIAASATPPPTVAATPGAQGQTVPRNAIRVPANEAWTMAGVRVTKGQRLSFSTTGRVQFSARQEHTAGPDGNPGVAAVDMPVTGLPVGGLIGKVGNSAPFPIGSNTGPIVMPETGLLMLGVNDSDLSDNSGFFAVVVAPVRR